MALLIGLIYTLPNFFGEAPAVQLSSGKATVAWVRGGQPGRGCAKQAGISADFC